MQETTLVHDATMESVPCPMCTSAQATFLLEGPDLLHEGPRTFRLVTCEHCGHIYQNPRPSVEAIHEYYPESYVPYFKAIEDEPHWWKRLDRRYGLYRRCQEVHQAAGKPGRLLDVGCATGIFLNGMRDLGWTVVGVEPSPSAAAYARERFGLTVFEGRLEDTSFADGTFDVITLWDVLEHVHEPRQVLADLARLLKPGGLLVMSLPNPDSLETTLFGAHWLGWDLPRHLNLFRAADLRHHLEAQGMRLDSIRSFTAGYSVFVLSLELKLRSEGWTTPWASRILRSWPLRLLALPYYAGPANWFNLSSIMVVFARRTPTEVK